MSLPTSPATIPKPQAPELVRGLNAWHATSIVAGTIIGSGIFLVPAVMMKAVGSAGFRAISSSVAAMASEKSPRDRNSSARAFNEGSAAKMSANLFTVNGLVVH